MAEEYGQGAEPASNLEFSDDELNAEQERLMKMTALCRNHGMADGQHAANAQANAISLEIEKRAGEKASKKSKD